MHLWRSSWGWINEKAPSPGRRRGTGGNLAAAPGPGPLPHRPAYVGQKTRRRAGRGRQNSGPAVAVVLAQLRTAGGQVPARAGPVTGPTRRHRLSRRRPAPRSWRARTESISRRIANARHHGQEERHEQHASDGQQYHSAVPARVVHGGGEEGADRQQDAAAREDGPEDGRRAAHAAGGGPSSSSSLWPWATLSVPAGGEDRADRAGTTPGCPPVMLSSPAPRP